MNFRTLDLNALDQPVLELTLLDDKKTTIHITVPELALIEEMYAISPELTALKNSQDAKSIQKLYDFTAKVLSNNEECLQITAEDLRDKYRVRFAHLIFIFRDYLDFIKSIEEVKN